MNENKLILDAQRGNQSSINAVMELYKPLVNKIARRYFIVSLEFSDIIQEGMIGLFNAYRSFDVESNVPFRSYVILCVKRQIQMALQKSSRQKNLPLNTYLSVDNQGKIALSPNTNNDEDDDEVCFFLTTNELSPEESVLHHEKLKEISGKLNNLLSPFERKVLGLFLKGLNYVEIAQILKKEPKSIDNALSRIKIKLRVLKGRE